MATIKSYTDLNQSKKLAEILPPESADMTFLSEESLVPKVNYNGIVFFNSKEENLTNIIPCWSLTALLDILPDRTCVYKKTCKDGRVKYKGVVKGCKELILKDNPVDACYEMIIKLHEQKLL